MGIVGLARRRVVDEHSSVRERAKALLFGIDAQREFRGRFSITRVRNTPNVSSGMRRAVLQASRKHFSGGTRDQAAQARLNKYRRTKAGSATREE